MPDSCSAGEHCASSMSHAALEVTHCFYVALPRLPRVCHASGLVVTLILQNLSYCSRGNLANHESECTDEIVCLRLCLKHNIDSRMLMQALPNVSAIINSLGRDSLLTKSSHSACCCQIFLLVRHSGNGEGATEV